MLRNQLEDELGIPPPLPETRALYDAIITDALPEAGDNKAYDLTGPEGLDYYQVADLFTQVLGRKITYTNFEQLSVVLVRA